MYKLNKDIGLGLSIQRIKDNACIPVNLDNVDYQNYIKWLEEGNTPLPMDE